MAGLLGSMFTGNSGLRAASQGVSVVGDNIANTNTVGFKSSRVHFQEMLQEYLVGANGANQIGRGVMMQRIEKLFTQGALQFTGVPTDMAIDGDGFFVVRGNEAGQSQNFYTRAGQFRFDKDGNLINQAGDRVQGYNSRGQGALSGIVEDVNISAVNLDPNPSTSAELNMSLNPGAEVYASPGGAPSAAELAENSSFRTTVVLYDSLGNAHSVEVRGTHTAAFSPGDPANPADAPSLDEWRFTAVIDGSELNGGAEGTPQYIDLGALQFDGQGRLDNYAEPGGGVIFNWAGAEPSTVNFGFGDSISDGGTGRNGTTLWGEVRESSLNSLSQNGYGTGVLQSITVDGDGFVSGAYSNGQSQVLAQVAMARFNDSTGLIGVGANNFVESNDSGPPAVGTPRTGSRGGVVSGSLEASNVELSEEFIDLIAYQRAFQANSRTITTADNLMQEVFQIIR